MLIRKKEKNLHMVNTNSTPILTAAICWLKKAYACSYKAYHYYYYCYCF